MKSQTNRKVRRRVSRPHDDEIDDPVPRWGTNPLDMNRPSGHVRHLTIGPPEPKKPTKPSPTRQNISECPSPGGRDDPEPTNTPEENRTT